MFHILVTRCVYTTCFVNSFSFDTFTKYDSSIYYQLPNLDVAASCRVLMLVVASPF